MLLKIGAGIAIALVIFLGYVSTRDGHFHYERSGLIKSTPEKIFPYISQLKLGSAWSPYEHKDPNMKKEIIGTDGQPGTIMTFDGNSEAGSGSLEILKVVPNEKVDIQLRMTKPLKGENLIEYILTPEKDGTRFTWAMSGDGGFLGKLVSTLIDCEKMVTKDFEVGIENLKQVVEKQ